MKLYLAYRIYSDEEMDHEFGSDWVHNESNTQLYAWTASKKFMRIFRDTHKKSMFKYETIHINTDDFPEEFYRRNCDKELLEMKLRYNYKLSEKEHVKVIMTTDEECKIDDAWSDLESQLFSENNYSIPTLDIFKEKYKEVLDLISLSYYWATIHCNDDDLSCIDDSYGYGIGPSGYPSNQVTANQFQLYVDIFDPILKGGSKS